jgi:ABC-2 type transport system permease protein
MKVGASSLGDFVYQFQIFVFNTIWIYTWSLSSPEIVLYLTVGRVISFLTNNFWYNKIASDIINGGITNVLLLPQEMFNIYFFQSLGARFYRNILSTFTIFGVLLVFNRFVIEIPFKNLNYSVLLFLPIVFYINFYIALIISSIAFFIKDKRDFTNLAESIQVILNIVTGLMIPFEKIPLFGSILSYLPFSLQFYHPTKIALGKYDASQTILVFLSGLVWCLVLYILAKVIFKLGLKKNESVGL